MKDAILSVSYLGCSVDIWHCRERLRHLARRQLVWKFVGDCIALKGSEDQVHGHGELIAVQESISINVGQVPDLPQHGHGQL